MTTPISERLRNEVNIGSGTVTPLRREAAGLIDELVAALEEARDELMEYELIRSGERYNSPKLNAALAKARS